MKKLILFLFLLSSFAAAQNTQTGNITTAGSDCSVATNCVSMVLASRSGAVAISLSGTFSATAQFEVSADNGTTWQSAQGTTPASGTATSATAAGIWRFAVSGLTNIRVRASVYSSGTVIVTIQSSVTAASLSSGSGLPAGCSADAPNGLACDHFAANGAGTAFLKEACGATTVSTVGMAWIECDTNNLPGASVAGAAFLNFTFLAGDIGGTATSPQITGLHLTAEGQAGNQALTFSIANDGTTGTVNAQLAKINASGQAITPLTTDTKIPVYPVVSASSTAGNARLAFGGTATCQFDASGGTAGHFVKESTATAGRCADAGATAPSSICTLGILQNSPAANANGTVSVSEACTGIIDTGAAVVVQASNNNVVLQANGVVSFDTNNSTFVADVDTGQTTSTAVEVRNPGNPQQYSIQMVNASGGTISSGTPVKISSTAEQVTGTITTDTAAYIVVGVVESIGQAGSCTNGANCRVVLMGTVQDATLGTGTCSIGNAVIVDTTTNGRVKCTASPTAGTVIGIATAAQASVGSAVHMVVTPK